MKRKTSRHAERYWFRPAKFWGIFAAYYPVSNEGWFVTLIAAAVLWTVFCIAVAESHSLSDALLAAAPWSIVILLAFDLISFRMGEYPKWWEKWRVHK